MRWTVGVAILWEEEENQNVRGDSTVALGQFAVYYWRSMVLGVASQAVSERIRTAAGITQSSIAAADFHNILILNDLTPDLRGPNGSFRSIRAYYAMMNTLAKLVPAMASRANDEMTLCARYIAVQMDQHLQRNIACAASIRGI